MNYVFLIESTKNRLRNVVCAQAGLKLYADAVTAKLKRSVHTELLTDGS